MVPCKTMVQRIRPHEQRQADHRPFKNGIVHDVNAKNRQARHDHR